MTDLVADLRAPTPTAAAELAVPVLADEIMKLEEYNQRMARAFRSKLVYLSGKLDKITHSVIFRQPKRLYDGYLQNVDQLESRLINEMEKDLRKNRQTVELLSQRLRGYPMVSQMKEKEQTVTYLTQKLQNNMAAFIKDKRYQVTQSIQALDHLSPLKILSRGYAVIEKDEEVVKTTDNLKVGDQLHVRLADGQVETVVENITKNKE